ncbi:MAG: aminomethyl-transferring glycine dehydrogenase subunit GcvPA [Fimbriimonadaceae bacterium]|nr:aminomethyl-transferring glycine dehydrogenase subunit GcvPA [Fimbriimonadaceae bacterium]
MTRKIAFLAGHPAMTYVPHTEDDVRSMLATIGAMSIDDLFIEIPDDLKLKGELNIPDQMDEHQLLGHLRMLSERNLDLSRVACFLGAGMYDRYIPASIGAVISRGEFLTSYTPYQPEVSQGYLQTIYEFQTGIAELYGCEIANASMYDGPTSLAEAAIMGASLQKSNRIAVSACVHPHYREVIHTYCWALGMEVVEMPERDGATDWNAEIGEVGAVVAQYPNFFGVIEDLKAVREAADPAGAKMVVSADPTACGILPPPGSFGADIVTGEGQPLGIPMGFGGPVLGLFACKREYARFIPGRIVGRAKDAQGRLGYTMTLRTREQDIRREKATSNICTNEALMALASTVYMAAVGKNGIRSVAESSVRNAQYTIDQLEKAGAKRKYPNQKVFCEFVVDLGRPAGPVRDALLDRGVLAGLPLGEVDPRRENELLVAVTEVRTKEQIDSFATAMKEVLAR